MPKPAYRIGLFCGSLLLANCIGCAPRQDTVAIEKPTAVAQVQQDQEDEPVFAGLTPSMLMEDPEAAEIFSWQWKLIGRETQGIDQNTKNLFAGLERFSYQELLKTIPTTPKKLIDGISKRMIKAGLSPEQAADTIDVMIADGLFEFTDIEQAIAATRLLRSHTAPVNATSDLELAAKSDLPKPRGGFWTSWNSSGEDPLGLDCIKLRRFEQPEDKFEDRYFFVDDKNFVAPVFKFGLTSGLLKDQKRFVRITGSLDIWRRDNPNELVFNKEFYEEREIIGSTNIISLPLFLDSVSTRATESFLARVKLTIQDKLDDGRWTSDSSELWSRLDPIKNSEPYSGLKVTPLGPKGIELANPILAHGSTYYFYRDILYNKSEIQKHLQRQADKKQKSKGLIGSTITKLQMAYSPGSKEPKVLSIPQKGRTVVIAGATWCGPCRALDPKVKEYAAHLASIGSGTKVIKVSIEDEKVEGDHVGSVEFDEEFPSGILAEQQQKDLVIEMVPWFLLIEDGVIVKQGVLSEERIAEFKTQESAQTAP